MKSGSGYGLLYMFITVCIGLFFCLLLCICTIIVAAFEVSMGRMVLCMSFFT